MPKFEIKILNQNLSNFPFLESLLGIWKYFLKNQSFNRSNKDYQLKVQSFFKYKNAFMVAVGFSSSGCGSSRSLVLKVTPKKS